MAFPASLSQGDSATEVNPTTWNAIIDFDNAIKDFLLTPQSISDADTTPDVGTYHKFKTANTGTTTITNFDNATIGQEIVIFFDDENTTVQSNANVLLQGGEDFTGSQYDKLVLYKWASTLWVEIDRKTPLP